MIYNIIFLIYKNKKFELLTMNKNKNEQSHIYIYIYRANKDTLTIIEDLTYI